MGKNATIWFLWNYLKNWNNWSRVRDCRVGSNRSKWPVCYLSGCKFMKQQYNSWFQWKNTLFQDGRMVVSHQCGNIMMGADEQDDEMVLYNEICLIQVLLISKCCHGFQPILWCLILTFSALLCFCKVSYQRLRMRGLWMPTKCYSRWGWWSDVTFGHKCPEQCRKVKKTSNPMIRMLLERQADISARLINKPQHYPCEYASWCETISLQVQTQGGTVECLQ